LKETKNGIDQSIVFLNERKKKHFGLPSNNLFKQFLKKRKSKS
jgi:hypothetical protein